jgi:hypothetical protein
LTACPAIAPDKVNKIKKIMGKDIISKLFLGRNLVIATMHGKENVLAPLLEERLGVNVTVANGIDTDMFGTFSGEKERTASPIETARKKCQEAFRLTGERLVLASEGSFGSHPVIGLVPANEELLLLKDMKDDWEIKARVISTKTNFSGSEYYNWDEVLYYSSQAGFPSHGLVIKNSRDNWDEIHKGINDWQVLKESFSYFKNKYGKLFIETDMRAHYNPTRMKVIGEACEKLVSVINNCCPICNSPGFDVCDILRGLPCRQCDTPTQTAKAYIYHCQFCGHSDEKKFPEKKKKEDPMFCDECNP